MANYRTAPKWFLERDYSYLNGLGLRGWRDELQRLRTLDEPIATPEWITEWGPIFAGQGVPHANFIGPPALHRHEFNHLRHAYIGPPTVQLIERPEAGADDRRLHRIELPALLVHLNAPDDVIMTQVKADLKKARERYPVPVAKPGRKAPNARFDDRTFTVWRNHKIVPVCELFQWRKGLSADEKKKYSNAALGSWLHFDDKKMSLAKDCLEKALESVPAIWAQMIDEEQKLENLTGI